MIKTRALMNFGQLLKEKRIAKAVTLRQCCADLKIDPSNWSKVERGLNPAPKDERTLSEWSDYFGLDWEEREKFMDLAAISRKELPKDVASDQKVLSMLPIFFRALRGKKMEGDKFQEFIADVRAVNSPDQQP